MLNVFAVTNRGLETISAQELAQVPGAQVTRVAYRRVHAAFAGKPHRLLALRTVDDLFIELAEWHGIVPQRDQLAAFEQLALDLDPWQAVNLRATVSPIGEPPLFSVTANFVGRRNYTAEEIKSAVANGVATISGWRYCEDDRESDINLRVFIEHDTALVGMRLAKSPLHRRVYKQEHLPGSLKPSVAAAMVLLAAPQPGSTLLDPCCGAGTILVEAAALGLHAVGGDHDPAAVAAAQQNAEAASAAVTVQTWNARSLPISTGSVDRIVCNLPWGRQVEVNAALTDFYAAACAEMERVLVERGRIVLLTSLAELVHVSKLTLEQRIEISLFGQQPTVLVFGTTPTVGDTSATIQSPPPHKQENRT